MVWLILGGGALVFSVAAVVYLTPASGDDPYEEGTAFMDSDGYVRGVHGERYRRPK